MLAQGKLLAEYFSFTSLQCKARSRSRPHVVAQTRVRQAGGYLQRCFGCQDSGGVDGLTLYPTFNLGRNIFFVKVFPVTSSLILFLTPEAFTDNVERIFFVRYTKALMDICSAFPSPRGDLWLC